MRPLARAIRGALASSTLAFILPSSVSAQPGFVEHVISSTANGAQSVFATDLDGDGDIDVLSASYNDDKIAWYENDGLQSFTLRTISTGADGAWSVFAADIDGDGEIDVVSGSLYDDKVAWYENDSAGGFTTRTITTNGTRAYSVFAADVDGDGHIDVLSGFGDGMVAWHENDGTGNFMPHTVATNANAARVFAADVDGDGDTDILSASGFNGAKLAWYENDGSEGFSLRSIPVNGGPISVFAADVNVDGYTDVVSASYSNDTIAWHENDGSESFSVHTIATIADIAQWVFAADLDRDGDTDVLSASLQDDKIAWYENDGSENFALRTIATSADRATSVLAADVDGDGDMDVLSASRDDRIVWYENDTRQKNVTLHCSSEISPRNIIATNANGAFSVFAADVDKDGHMDVLSASKNDAKIAWYENDGLENFTLHTVANNAGGATSVFAADVDGDTDTDVLSASSYDDKIAWYENDGSENFTLKTIATGADQAYSVFAAKVDKDEHLDVLSASFGDDKVAWYRNDGLENFSLGTIATNADGAMSVFAVDVNGDTETDLVSASFNDGKIAWYENDGSENFMLHTIATDAAFARSVFATDVDGDTDIDVLTASEGANRIAWYENDGSENFMLRTIASNASGASSVFATDLDGDQDIDVFSASRFDDKIAWYENDGSENFSLHIVDNSADGTRSVFAADVDGDGDADLLSAARYDNAVAWYENVCSQFALTGSTLPIPASVFDGDSFPLLRLQFDHRGRIGDASIELDSISLAFTDDSGNPLNTAQANGFVASIDLFLDDGDTTFEPGEDTLVATQPDLALTPLAFTRGIQTIPLMDDVVVIAAEESVSMFVVLELAANGSGQEPNGFRVALDNRRLPRSQASDVPNGEALSIGSKLAKRVASDLLTPLPVADLMASSGTGTETDTTQLTIAATTSGPVSGNQTLFVALGGTASLNDDYTLTDDDPGEPGIQITIPDGMSEATLTLDILDDALLEGPESIVLTLTNPTSGIGLGSTISQQIDITDNDSASLSIADVAMSEGDVGTTDFTFTTTLSGAVQSAFSVPYSLAAGSALAGEDFTDSSGNLGFTGNDGETQTFTVAVSGDLQVESNETFSANLGVPTNNLVGVMPATATGTILNDDSIEITVTRDGKTIDDSVEGIPATDSLGLVQPGSQTLTYVIENVGNANSSLAEPVLSNPVNVSNLSLTQPPASSIPGGGMESFSVAFDADSAGADFSFDVSFANDDLDENPYDFTVTGSVPLVELSAVLPQPTVLVDNDSDGIANPSDTISFGVTLRNDQDPAVGVVTFELTSPEGTTITRANRTVTGSISNTDRTITASFPDLEGDGFEFQEIITFDLLVDNEVAADVLAVRGQFSYGPETILTEDPNVGGPTLVPIGLISRLLAEDPSGLFGNAAAITEGFMAVASPGADGGAGSVRIYRILTDGTRQFAREITVPAGFVGVNFGADVAIDGDTLVIGSNDDSTAAKGATGNKVAIFKLNPDGTESLVAQIAGNLDSGFGSQVAVDGDTIIVSAPDEDEGATADAGAVYTYSLASLMAGSNTPQRRITANSPANQSRFGGAIACANNKIVIGAPGPADSVFLGSAAIYDAISNNLTDLEQPQEAIGQFGAAVAVEGNMVVVGSPKAPGGGGVFEYDLAGVRLSSKLVGSDTADGHDFGASVALDGGNLYVGAPNALAKGADGEGNFGAVYRFALGLGTKGLTEMEKIGAFSDSGSFQQQESFGAAVAVENGALVIGAPDSENQKGAAAFRKGNPAELVFRNGFEN